MTPAAKLLGPNTHELDQKEAWFQQVRLTGKWRRVSVI